ncbi:molybdate ABC transporter substrate-binding protein [Sulfurimonas sp.]|uniref:molybdate ABC transporter substrate-binding protein n=1 Tax=Sulfurimonas sp. TaxID=2022749 RepID=UPI0025FB95CC|nr:molybdate ABC transporter substrate-binding protein [Sulfurimonas sp.]
MGIAPSKLLFLSLLLGLVTLNAGTLNVAVASNVSYAIQAIKQEFTKKYPDTKIQIILASSGKLAAQIRHGAPYHIFMSADMAYPEALFKDNLTLLTPVLYAKGSLVMFSTTPQDFTLGINLVNSKLINKIAIASKTAPYGIATLQALKNSSTYENNKKKLVYAESISQTLSYARIATDIGFISKSALFTPQMFQYTKNKHWIEVNSKLYTPINQGIVILKNAIANKEAKVFYKFILSLEAKAIFKKFGYIVE